MGARDVGLSQVGSQEGAGDAGRGRRCGFTSVELGGITP